MNIQQIIYALEVHNYHSFTEAAKALFISQPRLSQAVRELEDELGFDIFIRNKKGIYGTTVKGTEFIRQAKILQTQFSGLESLKEDNRSSFHLSTTLVAQAQDAYIALCEENMDDNQLDLELWFTSCYESAGRIQSMESELGVVAILDDHFAERMDYFKSHNIEYHDLTHSPIYVTISKDNPLAAKSEIYPEDISGYTYITERCTRLNDLSARVRSFIDDLCRDSKIIVSNTHMMYSIAAKPGSRSFIFEPFTPPASTLEQYGLVSIPLAGNCTGHIGYIKILNRHLSPLAERYLELLHYRFGLTYEREESTLEADSIATRS